MGRWRALIPIGLALVIAIVGSVFIYSWIQQQAEPERERLVEEIPPEERRTVEVVVAFHDIEAGTKLSREDLTTEEFLQKSLPSGYYTDPAELRGRVVRAPLKSKEPIIEHRLAPTDVRTGGVGALITEGKRAVALGGDRIIGVSGFIHPGNRVDIMVTWSDPDTGDQITKRVLEDVPVLATGTQMQETEQGTTAPVEVYTVEVTPEEAEILTHARNQGRIQLAMRSPLDTEPVLTEGATIRVVMDHLRLKAGQDPRFAADTATDPEAQETEPAPRPVAPVAPVETIVEVIEGGKLVEKRFQD